MTTSIYAIVPANDEALEIAAELGFNVPALFADKEKAQDYADELSVSEGEFGPNYRVQEVSLF